LRVLQAPDYKYPPFQVSSRRVDNGGTGFREPRSLPRTRPDQVYVFREKKIQFKKFDAMKFTTQHDLD